MCVCVGECHFLTAVCLDSRCVTAEVVQINVAALCVVSLPLPGLWVWPAAREKTLADGATGRWRAEALQTVLRPRRSYLI